MKLFSEYLNKLPDRADPSFSGLLLLESILKECLEIVEFLPAGFPSTDVESVECVVRFKNVGLEHFV